VIEGAAVDVGEWKEGECNVFGGIEAEIVADVVDVGAKIAVREHDALGLAGSAGRVDERSELAGKNLGSSQAVGGNIRRACASDECFVAKTFGGNVSAAVGDDDLLQLREAGADGEKLLQLGSANNENDFCAAMFEDVGHAVRRFVEVNRSEEHTSELQSRFDLVCRL